MEKTIEELRKEADELGISYAPGIGAAKLASRIEEFYASQETTSNVIEQAVQTQAQLVNTSPNAATVNQVNRMNVIARRMEDEARVTHVVVITDNDQRENNVTTTVSVSCGNDYFDLGTIRIPLNIPVEVMQGHINVLKEIIIPQHVKDVDGSSRMVFRPRYSLAYQDELKSK